MPALAKSLHHHYPSNVSFRALLYSFSCGRFGNKHSRSHNSSGRVNLPHNLRVKSLQAARNQRHPYEEFDDSQLGSVSMLETRELRPLGRVCGAEGVGTSTNA